MIFGLKNPNLVAQRASDFAALARTIARSAECLQSGCEIKFTPIYAVMPVSAFIFLRPFKIKSKISLLFA